MVAHQAVRPDSHFEFQGVFQQQVQIGLPVFVIEEHRGAVVTTLGDVVRISGGYDAGNAGHGGILAQGESGCNGNMGSVPHFQLEGGSHISLKF